MEKSVIRLLTCGSVDDGKSTLLARLLLDTDSLPDYQTLDQVLALLIEHSATIDEVVANGHPRQLAEKVEGMVRASEWKRSQGAIGTKTTSIAFGSGRRVPITTRFTQL